MRLRRAVRQLDRRRVFKSAIRTALGIALAGSASNLAVAQQAATLPLPVWEAALPTQGPGTAIILPALPDVKPCGDECCDEATRDTSRDFVRLIGLKSRKPVIETPSLPPSTPVAGDKPAAEPGLGIVWSAQTPSTPDSLPAQPRAASMVVAAAATAPGTGEPSRKPAARASQPQQMKFTIGDTQREDAFCDIDIPLMLPSYDETTQAKTPAAPSTARQPEIVASGRATRLSGDARQDVSAPRALSENTAELADTAETSLPAQTGAPQLPRVQTPEVPAPPKRSSSPEQPIAQLPEPKIPAPNFSGQPELVEQSSQRVALNTKSASTHFSLSDSSTDLTDAEPDSQANQGQAEAREEESSKETMAGSDEPTTAAELARVATSELPSTSSSRNQPHTGTGMQVQIEGETPASDMASSRSNNSAPRPTFQPQATKLPKRFTDNTSRFTDSNSAPTASRPRPIPASFASQPGSGSVDSQIDSTASSRRSATQAHSNTDASASLPVALPEVSRKLRITAEQTISLDADSTIQQTSVEDPSICSLILSGENTVSLVGIQSGTTRVAIVTTSPSGKPDVQVYQITVDDAGTAQVGLAQLADSIDATVVNLYQGSDISVSAGDGNLIVAGFASSENEAKRILSLVRRTSLMPVIDRVQVKR